MKIAPIFVDSWTIAVMKLLPNDRYIDEKKLYDTITNRMGHIVKLDQWIYKRKINNTWNGNIEWELKINNWLYYIWDPCYVIGDLRDDFIWEFLCDENSKTTPKMIERRMKLETYIIDEMWWDWIYLLSLTKKKNEKR